jgi:hypothetical protein
LSMPKRVGNHYLSHEIINEAVYLIDKKSDKL